MLNNDLFSKMALIYDQQQMIQFSGMLSNMYYIIYLDNPEDCSECLFEMKWWQEKHEKLVKTK